MIQTLIVPAGDRALLQMDLAGSPAANHLAEALARVPGLRVAERAGLGPAVVLIVDERAWLAPGMLEDLLRRMEGGAVTRIVDVRGRSLAMCLPAPVHALSPGAAGELLQRPAATSDVIVAAESLAGGAPPCLIDSLAALADCEARILLTRAHAALAAGVRVRHPWSLHIRGSLQAAPGVEIDVNVLMEGQVTLGEGVTVGAGCILRDVSVGARTRIQPFSLLEQAAVGADGLVGPYARLRPGTQLGDRVQIGNFVEVKNARIDDGCRINHHSFIGDATVEENVTIGAGTITCNHDGFGTHRTLIGRNVTIGSGCNLVAPITVGESATIGAGSTLNRDVPAGKLTIARAIQTTVDNWRGPRSRRRD